MEAACFLESWYQLISRNLWNLSFVQQGHHSNLFMKKSVFKVVDTYLFEQSVFTTDRSQIVQEQRNVHLENKQEHRSGDGDDVSLVTPCRLIGLGETYCFHF
jgi:hypothetical protein